MHLVEPTATAWVFAIVGTLMLLAVLASRLPARLGVPLFLVLLALGMLAGEDGPGGIEFDNYPLAFRFGVAALAFILFDGGLNTPAHELRLAYRPALSLATVGVLVTAGLLAAGAMALGFDRTTALLLGAIVSPTDAAAVFNMIRSSGIGLKLRVRAALELESGFNDPVAVILVSAFTTMLAGDETPWWQIALMVVVQLAIGAMAGILAGRAAARLIGGLGIQAGGLFVVLSVAIVLLAFGLPTILYGSGFLAVYVAGVELGRARFRHRAALVRFHDAAAWIAQVGMFLMLGLLVDPSRLLASAPAGLALAIGLALVARPIAVAICTAPFRFRPGDVLFLGLVGPRGAVPVVLATMPVLAGAAGAEQLFDLVFFIVLVSALFPGPLLASIARRTAVAVPLLEPPHAVLEIHASDKLEGELVSFRIDPALAVAGVAIRDVPLPEGTTVSLVLRGPKLVPPRGSTVLEPGDHVYLLAPEAEVPALRLLFGAAESPVES